MNKNFYNSYRFVAAAVSPFISRKNVIKLLDGSTQPDWEWVAYIAGYNSIVQALYPSFCEKELLQHIPEDFLEYVKNINEVNCERNNLLRMQLIEAVSSINKLGIKPLLMKGAGQLFLNTFQNPGDRLMVDLDILVPEKSIERVRQILIDDGYSFATDNPEAYIKHLHYPPAIKKGEVAAIELHRDLMLQNQQHYLPNHTAWENSFDITLINGVEAKVLTPTYRILHSFLHSCIADSNHLLGLVEIRQLHELSLTQLVYSNQIEWEKLTAITKSNKINHIFTANIAAAHNFMQFPKSAIGLRYNTITSKCHTYRVNAKLKYQWYNYVDAKVSTYLDN